MPLSSPFATLFRCCYADYCLLPHITPPLPLRLPPDYAIALPLRLSLFATLIFLSYAVLILTPYRRCHYRRRHFDFHILIPFSLLRREILLLRCQQLLRFRHLLFRRWLSIRWLFFAFRCRLIYFQLIAAAIFDASFAMPLSPLHAAIIYAIRWPFRFRRFSITLAAADAIAFAIDIFHFMPFRSPRCQPPC